MRTVIKRWYQLCDFKKQKVPSYMSNKWKPFIWNECNQIGCCWCPFWCNKELWTNHVDDSKARPRTQPLHFSLLMKHHYDKNQYRSVISSRFFTTPFVLPYSTDSYYLFSNARVLPPKSSPLLLTHRTIRVDVSGEGEVVDYTRQDQYGRN